MASTIIGDLRDAGLSMDDPHKCASVVVASLRYMLPNETDQENTDAGN